jgi:hypothetical protein
MCSGGPPEMRHFDGVMKGTGGVLYVTGTPPYTER